MGPKIALGQRVLANFSVFAATGPTAIEADESYGTVQSS